jgi:peroxiredoxin
MPRSDNLHTLPADLPIPIDDGACDHLVGLTVPPLLLHATTTRTAPPVAPDAAAPGGISLRDASAAGRVVVYAYPRTGRPDHEPPPGWNDIPGARGCTPQTCGFRDHHAELTAYGVRIFGLSTQSTAYQQEAADRLHLPFPLLSDEQLALTHALQLPTFTVAGMTLLKRFTLVLHHTRIEKVFYPVFPPDASAAEVLRWLGSPEVTP